VSEISWSKWRGAFLVLTLYAATATGLRAQTLTTLVTFNGIDGFAPSGLIQGADGNFYGTTLGGGTYSQGNVFKFTPGGAVTTIYSFCLQPGCADGALPLAGLIQASDGNFYGTTANGGALSSAFPLGYGTIFKITPNGALTTLYSFCSQPGCADGAKPSAALMQGPDGNFYGTTSNGGLGLFPQGNGTVFKITPGGALTTLYSFCSQGALCTDGAGPLAGLIQASDGNFYGTTGSLGANGGGTIFKITPAGSLTTLYSFCSQAACFDGRAPEAGLIQGADGNFYGTTSLGGANDLDGGTVFKITPGGDLTTLYNFCSLRGCADGQLPWAALMQGSDGNFYGTTMGIGEGSYGTVFRMTPAGTLTTLYSFFGGADGAYPRAGLIQATDGNLYGTTWGPAVGGTMFEVVLNASTAVPAINPNGVISAGSFQPGIAPGSWITITGTNLSSVTDNWANLISSGNLPTSLDGVSVSVGGSPAYISYISPTQINALAPNVAPGTLAVTVTHLGKTSPPVNATVEPLAPAFFQWGTYAVATRQDYSPAVKNGTLSTPTVPAAPGDVIILWGTGFGPTSPSAPAGVVVPSTTTYSTGSPVTVTVGGLPATVYGAALTSGSAGLYQVAIQIPTSLASGDYPVIATISNSQSPSTTLITVQ
jgi:uncharacterized protein (TIGR03437 family)